MRLQTFSDWFVFGVAIFGILLPVFALIVMGGGR